MSNETALNPVSFSITENALQQFLAGQKQREMDMLEQQKRREQEMLEQANRKEKEMIERHYESMNSLAKMFFMPSQTGNTIPAIQTDPSQMVPPSTSGSSGIKFVKTSSTLPTSGLTKVIKLNTGKSNKVQKEFQGNKTPRGAMIILNLRCTEKNCDWIGLEKGLLDHLRVVHHILVHRCLVLHCGKSFKTQ